MDLNGGKIFEITLSDAYGEYYYDMVQTILKEKILSEKVPEVGQQLSATADGDKLLLLLLKL